MNISNTNPYSLKKKIFYSAKNNEMQSLLKKYKVNTVCQEARCPNKSECYNDKTATFLILGDSCTRSCKFCSVQTKINNNKILDNEEPKRIANIISLLKLKYVVITSVTRDDLMDGGSEHFEKTIRTIKNVNKSVKVEVLTPDFQGRKESIIRVINGKPNVYNHNLETVKRLTPLIRNKGSYSRSLSLLEFVKNTNPNMIVKTGIILGLGESENELISLFRDIKQANCDILTMGQYLQPSKKNMPVKRYISEEEFKRYKELAFECGIAIVYASPFVRSSYKAYDGYMKLKHINNF